MSGNYESELQNLLRTFAPAGGFGIPRVNNIADMFRRQNQQGYRTAIGQENLGFDRMGLGNSVAKAFSPGTRQIQFNQDLMDQLTKLFSQHGQLAESQRQGLLGMLSPIAQERANRPSWLSTLLGGALGIGAQVAIPGIGGKLFPSAMDQFFKSQGGGQTSAPRSGGYGAYGQQFPQFNLPTGHF